VCTAPGTYPITCEGADAGGNYFISHTDGTLTVRPPACSDGRDNDGNGTVDYPSDFGCAGPLDTSESAPIPCPSIGRVANPLGGLLQGGRFADKLIGGRGKDILWGLGGNDCLDGGARPDRLLGGYGNDLLAGGTGADTLLGSFGNDVLGGGSGADTLLGGDGDDLLNGGTGPDVVSAGAGNDRIVADGGIRDVIDCGPGNDVAVVDRYDVVRNCETKIFRRTGPVLY
jgi:Ca2+-binding RTX toxin-like protein